jgi:predicted phosphodiesterase
MKACILGDVHAEWTALNVVIAKALKTHPDITHIFQVGDFGYAWPGVKNPFKFSRSYFTDEQLAYLENEVDKRWLDGNHENFTKLIEDCGKWQPGWTWMPRGEILEVDDMRIMFFGGASSWDKERRVHGISWWPDEEITYAQTQAALQKPGPIDIILSHDHPSCIPYSEKRYGDMFGKGDRDSLQALFDKFQPKVWLFGHHHRGAIGREKDTTWICCPIVDKGAPPCYTIVTSAGTVDRYWSRERRSEARKRPPFKV